MTFDELYAFGHSWLELSQSLDRIHLHIANSSYISGSSTLDFSKTKWVGIYPGVNNTDTTFGSIFYHEFLGIVGTNVNLVGEVTLAASVKDAYKPQSKVIIEAANITLFSDAHVSAGYTLMHANHTLELMEGAKISTLRENTCNTDRFSKDLFTCIKPNSLEDALTQTMITANF